MPAQIVRREGVVGVARFAPLTPTPSRFGINKNFRVFTSAVEHFNFVLELKRPQVAQ